MVMINALPAWGLNTLGQACLTTPQHQRRNTPSHGPPKKLRRVDTLALQVGSLSSEFAQIKEFLLNLQPDNRGPAPSGDSATRGSPCQEDDVLSTTASCSLFTEQEEEAQDVNRDTASMTSGAFSQGSDAGSLHGSDVGHATLKPAIRMALACLGLDEAPVAAAPSSAFFRQTPQPSAFSVPPSKPYIEELHKCWADPKRFSHHTSDCRILAAMQEAGSYGLDRMDPLEPTIASLIVSPDEALRPDARCPRPQCRLTDDLLTKSYHIAAYMGHLGNSLSHFILALSQTLQESGVDSSAQTLSDASLQTSAFMSGELGRLMSTVTLARRQVWLAQSPLSEACRRTLHTLPVVAGQIFGPAAQQALDRSAQADQVRQRFAGLQRGLGPVPGRRGPLPSGHSHFHPPARPGGQPRTSHNTGHYDQRRRASSRPTFQVPRGLAPSGRPPKGSRSRGGRT
ncbi:hypothetical protein ABVT39_001691 [Epinephelus coioides]